MGVLALTDKARRKHTRIVHNKQIAGFKLVDKIVKMQVLNFAGFSVNAHHARMVALLHRVLSDKLLWKVKIKIAGFQKFHLCFRCTAFAVTDIFFIYN